MGGAKPIQAETVSTRQPTLAEGYKTNDGTTELAREVSSLIRVGTEYSEGSPAVIQLKRLCEEGVEFKFIPFYFSYDTVEPDTFGVRPVRNCQDLAVAVELAQKEDDRTARVEEACSGSDDARYGQECCVAFEGGNTLACRMPTWLRKALASW